MIKGLAKCVREYKGDTILAPLLVGLETGLEVLLPLIMAGLIDKGIDQGNMSVIAKYGMILLAISFCSLAAGIVAGRKAAFASAGFAKNLRHDIFYNVQNFSFSNIDKFSTGSIVTRLTTDINNVQMAFQMIIRAAFRAPLMLIFSLSAAFSINKSLSLVFVLVVPIMVISLCLIMAATFKVFDKMFKTYDKLNNRTQENLHGIRVVKSFVRENHETELFKSVSEKIYKYATRGEKNIAFNMPVLQFCMYVCILVISWFGARVIVSSGGNADIGLSTGELMSLLTYVMQVLMSLLFLSMIFVMITMAKSSAERIFQILTEESDLTNGEHPVYEVKDGSIEFENVDFSYFKDENKNVLNNVNLKIDSGETIGIIGSTGSSKSTLVQMIPRLYDVTAGSVKVGGVDVREYDLETLRNQVAMVLQKNVLFSGTIADNLRWGNENATEEELQRVCDLAQASEFISKKEDGINSVIEQGGSNVSGGQKQRLTIARALLKKPKILILDDSTSAVDTKTDSLIRKAFRQEIPDTTKLIIAQRISSVQDADRILVLDDGNIAAFGKHDELLEKSEVYREIYDSQMKGGLSDE